MPERQRRIFITVAEVSGDQHAAQLIRSLRALDPDLQIEGLGGPHMAAAGATVHHETTGRAAMMHHALSRVREMWRLLKWTRAYFAQNPPDLHVCVDSPAMNFHFAKLAHAHRVPVLYYIAPQVWAWREGRMRKIRRWVDHVACILPFEEEYFRRHGVNATFVGHPLFDELPAQRSGSSDQKFPHRPPVIGLLTGSRRSEADQNFSRLMNVAELIRQSFPNVKFLAPTTGATDPVVRAMTNGVDWLECEEGAFDRMVPQCDLCITVSGTATLHVAGFGVPMIVVYRGNPVLWHLLGRWLVKTRTYSLVNLLADSHEHIVPEFIPWYGSVEPVAERAIEYLREPGKLTAQADRLRRLIQSLDRPGASSNVARLAMQMLDNRSIG